MKSRKKDDRWNNGGGIRTEQIETEQTNAVMNARNGQYVKKYDVKKLQVRRIYSDILMAGFSLRPYFVPWRSPCRPFRFSLSNPLRFARFFSALSRRNFQRKHGTKFQVFNGPRENRFGSDAVAGNLFRDVLRLFVHTYLAVATEMVENCIPVDYMIFLSLVRSTERDSTMFMLHLPETMHSTCLTTLSVSLSLSWCIVHISHVRRYKNNKICDAWVCRIDYGYVKNVIR